MMLFSTLLGCTLAAAPVALSWTAPDGCPQKADLLEQVELLAQAGPRADLQAAAVASVTPTGFSVRLITRRGEAVGERLLSAPTCDEATRATALVLAMAVGQERLVSRPLAPPVPYPTAPAAPPTRAFARPILGAELGSLSLPSAVFGAGGGIVRGPLRLEARAVWGAPQQVPKGPREGTGAELQRPVSVGLGACYGFLEGKVVPSVCAGLEAGILRGRGVGVSNPQAGSALLVGALAGGALDLTLSERLFLRLEASAGPNLTRPEFSFDDFGVVHRPAAWTAEALVGVEMRL